MKGRWVYIVLAASLALNIAALSAFAFQRYRRWQRHQGIIRRLARFEPQRVAPILDEYQNKMDSLRLEYWRARQKLALLSFEEEPDKALVEGTLDRVALLHKEINQLVYETGRKTGLVLPPIHRERLRRHWCEMMEGPPTPPGRKPFAPCGRPEPGHRWRR